MKRYTYRFVWKDKETRKFIMKFIDAPSEFSAIEDFEKEFKVSVQKDSVKVMRIRN